jgi:hypothetical protein
MNYTAQDIKIVNTKHVTGTNSTGQTEQQVAVTFTVGTHGPFYETFPAAGFDPMQARQKMLDFAQKLGQLHG